MSFGWKFTLILGGCVTLYVGGGIVHNKVKGEQLQASNIKRLLPHVEQWSALAGLVTDGCAFSRARWHGVHVGSSGSAGGRQPQEGRHAGDTAACPQNHDKREKQTKRAKKAKKQNKTKVGKTGALDEPLAAAVPTKAAGTAAADGGRWVHVPV
jgi:hypothetical protein